MVKIKGSRSHNTIALPLDIPNVKISKVSQNERGDYVITVESTLRSTKCQHCGRKLTKLHARGREIELRRAHLAVRGGSKGKQIIESSIDPVQAQVEQMVEAIFTPAHTNSLETLLNEPFTGTFHQTAADR